MSDLAAFLQTRKAGTNQYFPSPGSGKTVLISSYIWWTELMAYALIRLGFNVLVAEPWYGLWTDDNRFANFDGIYANWIDVIRRLKVQLVIGGNSTIAVPHVRTRELLHRAAGVPAVSYWWDEPRNMPPMTRRGMTAADHFAGMRDEKTLNVFWDIDIREEMSRFYGIEGVHVPLGATPEFWQASDVPLGQRPMKLCFLGNNHDEGTWRQTCDPHVLRWAEQVAGRKLADLDRPMTQCVEAVGTPGDGGAAAAAAGAADGSAPAGKSPASTVTDRYTVAPRLEDEFARWNILGAVLLSDCRNRVVTAAAAHLGRDLVLVGKGWQRLGLQAQKEHSGVPAAREFYAASQASLNLFGGCVHGGMPLRPYEICASNGLLFTQYNRELPSLFDLDRECSSFKTPGAMIEGLDRILKAPAEFDAVVRAGRERVLAEHTWEHRMMTVLDHAKVKFDLPW